MPSVHIVIFHVDLLCILTLLGEDIDDHLQEELEQYFNTFAPSAMRRSPLDGLDITAVSVYTHVLYF